MESPLVTPVAPPPRPLGVTLGAGFAGLWGGVALLFLVGSVLGSGPYRIDGELVSKRAFLLSPVMGFFACAAAYTLVTSYCVFTRRYPARRLMIVPWIVAILSYFVVPLADESSRFLGAGLGILWLVGVLWYLYRKPNVRAYFDCIEAEVVAPSQQSEQR